MKSIHKKILLTLLPTLLLTGCSLSPIETPMIQSYAILPTQTNTLPTNTSSMVAHKTTVHLTTISATAPYDSNQIFYSTSPYNIAAYHYNQWIAPPSTMLSNTLSQYLNQTTDFVILNGNYIGNSQLHLTINLNSLIQVFNSQKTESHVELNVSAFVANSNSGKTLATENFLIKTPAEPNPLGMVKATNLAAKKLVLKLTVWLQNINRTQKTTASK